MEEEIVGEDRGTSEKKIPDGGVTNQSGALFTCPIGVRVRTAPSTPMNSISAGDGVSGTAAGVL